MEAGPEMVDASIEKIHRQSVLQNLLTYVLIFSTCVSGAGRILGRHKDISFQCFTMTLWSHEQHRHELELHHRHFDGRQNYIMTR